MESETIEDILKEIRDFAISDALEIVGIDTSSIADRIEAAHKREHEATCEKSSQVGNNAKMREALSDACYAMFNFLKTQNGGFEEMAKALDKAKAALAEPPRACDRYPTFAAALDAWREVDPRDAGTFDEWIFAEAKGGAE